MGCSVLSVVFIMVGSALDYSDCKLSVDEMLMNLKHVNGWTTISALGTVVFAFGGHSSFPVILHDMKRPSHFTKSSYMAFGGITLLYVPMAIVGYLSYGGTIKSSIINSIQTVWVQQVMIAF
jgi:amino acid permease